MDLNKARQVVADNYNKEEGSLCYLMNEEADFNVEAFWALYDAVCEIVRSGIRDGEITYQIAGCYQSFLKEMIWHFAPDDIAEMGNLPDNYNEYIEIFDLAVRAYLEGRPDYLSEGLESF